MADSAPVFEITLNAEPAAKKTKGRGFGDQNSLQERYSDGKHFESLNNDGNGVTQKSVEGWIVFISGLHAETAEDNILDTFGEFGSIQQLHLNPDRRTGFVKGYALIEYTEFQEAEDAINGMNNEEFLGETITVGWAFKRAPRDRAKKRSSRKPRRRRSPSP